MASIKKELIGTWKLLSYIEVAVDGSDSLFPVGKNPKGILIFNPDGYMSVQITSNEHRNFMSEDRTQASDEEYRDQVLRYIAFSGRYTVNNDEACVIYDIETSLFPNWTGAKQTRKLDFENDILYQKTLEPIMANGILVHAYMTWKRIGRESFSNTVKSDQVLMERS